MNEILRDMLSNYGLAEVDGPNSNPKIIEFFREIGYDWVTDDSATAWCSAVVNYFAKKNGYQRSGKLDARSRLKVGERILEPELGDIVVFWRGSPDSWKGHVGLFINQTTEFVYCLGGNQSNEIRISAYRRDTVLGYRRLKKIEQ